MQLQAHLEKLGHFLEVAKTGSLTQAGKNLRLTQPSVTKSIRILEDVVGRKLLVRRTRGVSLTSEGELLKQFCLMMFAQILDIEAKLKAPLDPHAGVLRVGTYDSIAIYFWPRFFKKIIKQYPNLKIDLMTDRSRMIQKRVEEGELDLGLIVEPYDSSTTKCTHLATDSFHLYASSQFTIGQIRSFDSPIILMPDALVTERKAHLFEMMMQKAGRRRMLNTSSLETAKELTIAGIGVGLLPAMVATVAVQKKQMKSINLPGFPKVGIGQHRIGLVYPKESSISETLELLIQEIKKENWAAHVGKIKG